MSEIRYRVLTLWQPWATYMAAGIKRYETRSWHPNKALTKGEIIMIHAAKRWDKKQSRQHSYLSSQFVEIDDIGTITDFGCILGAFRYLGAEQCEVVWEQIGEVERAVGNYGPGRYAWEFELMKLADPPIPARGQQGLWTWSQADA